MANLEQLITTAKLEDLAGMAAFERGENYFAEGAVGLLRLEDDKAVRARVMGSEAYQVKLWAEGDGLGYDCTCPRAADGYFCKHCVAVGLALLDERARAPDGDRPESRRDPESLIREFLRAQSHEVLTGLLMDQAQRDDALYRGLLLKAERAGGSVDALKSFRKAIDSATRIRGFVDWNEAGGFASDLGELADSLEELLEPGSADALVELAEYAIERVDKALAQVDDSNGAVGRVLARLGELHVRACALARPDPVALAERLFRYETSCSFDSYYDSVRTYREVLGKEGIARFRELAEQQWEKIQPKGADERQSRDDSSMRFRITHIMETLAELSGDIDALVAVKSRDLSHPYAYLTIAGIYQKAGQADRALEWAERGLQAFPERPDDRLRDFLVAAYLERGRHDEALQLAWIQFEGRPTLENYRKLHDVAETLGRWQEQRQRALGWIETAVLRAANEITRWKPKPTIPDWSSRVEIALWENDLDTAWRMIQQGQCRRHLLLALANQLEKPRPSDAVALYRRIIPGVLEETNNRAYEEAVRYLGKLSELMQSIGNTADLGDYLAELRLRYKAKRNFIKLLDGLSYRVGGHWMPKIDRPSPRGRGLD